MPRNVGAPELRALSVGEVLDAAIKIYFRHARTLFLLVLLIVAPTQVLISLIDLSASEGIYSTGGEIDPAIDVEDVPRIAAGLIVIVLLTLLSATLATGACFKAIVDGYLGGQPSWRESLAFVARRLHSLVWVSILVYLLAVVALLALILPGIWLFVAWSVAVPALLTEDLRGRRALGRSFRLVRGRWWPTFGIVVLGTLLSGIVAGVIGGLTGALTFAADSDTALFLVNTLGGTLGSLVSTPFTAAFITVLYVDLRVRKEGFDLQLLAQRVGSVPGDVPIAVPPPPPAGPSVLEGEQPPFWPPPPGWTPQSDRSTDE